MSTYTPGPWVASLPTDLYGKVLDQDLFTEQYWFIEGPGADVHGYMSDDDARLIAAAPDLLEALKSLWLIAAAPDLLGDDMFLNCAVADKARAAILKATGGTK